MPRAMRVTKMLGGLAGFGKLGNALAYGFARHRQRRLADLLLALGEVEVERAPGRPAGGQNVVERGAVIALLAQQFCRRRQRFPFGISSFCHARKYQLQIGMSTFIVYMMTDIVQCV